jgi:glycosyltransferase involved in cell wall biosynthesis
MKILCVAWAKGSRRIESIASLVSGELWSYVMLPRVKLLAPFRYLIQGFITLMKLFKEKPEVVIVQNPPIFAPLVSLFYTKLFKKRLVIDHHCIWSEKTIKYPLIHDLIKFLERITIRRAEVNTSPNDFWTEKLINFGAKKALTLYDFVDKEWFKDADLSIREHFPKNCMLILAPCGGHPLERPDVLIEAVKDLENVIVVITGRKKYLRKYMDLVAKLNVKNVYFTDFLPEDKYKGLLLTCDFIANISDEPYTIPHFIAEGLAAGKPIISSNNPAIANVFKKGVIKVNSNNPLEVKEKLELIIPKKEEYIQQAYFEYNELKRKSKEQEKTLLNFISKPIGE